MSSGPANPFMQAAGAGTALAPQNQAGLPAQASGFGGGQIQMNIEEVDFESDIQPGGLERFSRMNKGEVRRIGFLLFKPNGQPRIKVAQSYSFDFSDENHRASFQAPTHNKDLMREIFKVKKVEPTYKFVTVVAQYGTDQYGVIIVDPATGLPRLRLAGYVFNAEKWNSLKGIHLDWGLSKNDVKLTCTDASFQRMNMEAAAQGHKFMLLPAQTQQELLVQAEQYFETGCNRMLGFARSDADIMQYLRTGVLPKLGQNNNGGGGQQGGPGVGGIQPSGQNPFQVTPDTVAAQAGVGAGAASVFSDLVAGATQGAETPAH